MDIYQTTASIGTMFKVGFNTTIILPGMSFVALKDHQAAIAEKDHEIAELIKQRDNWHAIVKDDCDADEDFRKVAGSWDGSDSYGVEPHADILEKVLKAYNDLMANAVKFAQDLVDNFHLSTNPDGFLESPAVKAWRARKEAA